MINNTINDYSTEKNFDTDNVNLSEAISLIGELAKMLSNHTASYFPDDDIPKGMKLILQCLMDRDGVTQLYIVNFTGFKPPTISILIKKMEALGYVTRRPDEYDLRAMRVFITDEGVRIYRDAVKVVKSIESIVLKDLTEEEKTTMVLAMRKIKENLNKI